MSTTIDPNSIANWGPARKLNTARGPRLLRTAPATERFWAAWRKHKQALKDAGISCAKNRNHEWEACWWQPLDPEQEAKRTESIEQSRAADADIDIPAPEGLEYLPFQRGGIAYALARKNTLIADEMGLGKTIQAIGVMNADPSIHTVLVVCPASLKRNWEREITKWSISPRTVGIADANTFPNTNIVIVNYDVLTKPTVAAGIAAKSWHLLIADECHYAKNPKAKRSKALYAIQAGRRLFLTGTPILNRPVELQPIAGALHSDFSDFWRYARRYCNAHKTRFGWDFTGASNLEELQQRLRSTIMVRRLKKDVLTELPPKVRQVVELPRNGANALIDRENKEAAEHEAKIEHLLANVELAKAEGENVYREAVARLTEAYRVQFAAMARVRKEVAIAKVIPALEAIRDTAESTGKVVVFAHHHEVIDRVSEECQDLGCVTVDGRVSLDARQAAVDRFQRDPECRVFVGGIHAAGVGLTLTAASHVIFLELDWTPGWMTQAEDRCHRIGQTDSVHIQHLVFDGSLDARMARMLVDKQAIAEKALDSIMAAAAETGRRKHAPATEDATPTTLTADVSDEERQTIHLALRILAGMCDGARDRDNAGFSKIDSHIGHSLAEQSSLSPRQAALGARLVNKYRRQLDERFVELAKTIIERM